MRIPVILFFNEMLNVSMAFQYCVGVFICLLLASPAGAGDSTFIDTVSQIGAVRNEMPFGTITPIDTKLGNPADNFKACGSGNPDCDLSDKLPAGKRFKIDSLLRHSHSFANATKNTDGEDRDEHSIAFAPGLPGTVKRKGDGAIAAHYDGNGAHPYNNKVHMEAEYFIKGRDSAREASPRDASGSASDSSGQTSDVGKVTQDIPYGTVISSRAAIADPEWNRVANGYLLRPAIANMPTDANAYILSPFARLLAHQYAIPDYRMKVLSMASNPTIAESAQFSSAPNYSASDAIAVQDAFEQVYHYERIRPQRPNVAGIATGERTDSASGIDGEMQGVSGTMPDGAILMSINDIDATGWAKCDGGTGASSDPEGRCGKIANRMLIDRDTNITQLLAHIHFAFLMPGTETIRVTGDDLIKSAAGDFYTGDKFGENMLQRVKFNIKNAGR